MMKQLNRMMLTALAAATLVACSGGDQDTGSSASLKKVSGRAVDGPITQGIVYVDTNGNNMRDVWEVAAFTDSKGYFGYNPVKVDPDTNTAGYDYCKRGADVPEKPSDETSQAYKDYLVAKSDASYCLQLYDNIKTATIRISKGYDTSTNEKFFGTLSLETTFSSQDYKLPVAVTPVTAMVHAASLSDSVFPANEGLSSAAVASEDFMDLSSDMTEADRRILLSLAMLSHKVAEVMSSYIDATTTNEFGGASSSQPYDLVPYVQKAIAELVTGTSTLADVLTTKTNLETIISTAWQAAYDDLSARGQTFSVVNNTTVTDLASRLDGSTGNGLADAIVSMFSGSEAIDSTYIAARFRAIEVIAALMRDTTVLQATIDTAITDSIDSVFLTNIGDTNADVASVIAAFKNGTYAGPASIDFSNRQPLGIDASGGFLGVGSATDATHLGFQFNPDGTVNVSGAIGDGGATDGNIDINTTYETVDANTVIMNMELVEGSGIYQPVVLKTNADGTGYTVDYGSGPTEFVTAP